MKKILLILLAVIPFSLSAQKVDFDKTTKQVTVDGVNSFKIDRNGCGFGTVDCYFDVYDVDSNRVIRINYRSFNSPVERSNANPQGIVRYYEFIFLETKKKAETEYMAIKEEKVAKAIVKNRLFVNGKLDEKAVDEFILINGTRFSERIKF